MNGRDNGRLPVGGAQWRPQELRYDSRRVQEQKYLQRSPKRLRAEAAVVKNMDRHFRSGRFVRNVRAWEETTDGMRLKSYSHSACRHDSPLRHHSRSSKGAIHNSALELS